MARESPRGRDTRSVRPGSDSGGGPGRGRPLLVAHRRYPLRGDRSDRAGGRVAQLPARSSRRLTRQRFFLEGADAAELLAAFADEGLRTLGPQGAQVLAERGPEVAGGGVPIAVSAARRLGDDGVDDPEAEQIASGDLHDLRGLGRFGG